jgi:hypothetical protein
MYLGENLIFIISQPRSGSTLLQRVLSGHPSIQTSAETWLMLHPLYAFKETGIETEYDARWAASGVNEFLDNYTDGRGVYDDAIREWARVIYGNALAKSGKPHFLDKTPRYFFVIPDLYRLFPRAKFVFLLRNPMAVLASELVTYVKGDWPVLGLFAPDLLLAPTLLLEGIEALGNEAIVVRYEEFVTSPERSIEALCNQLGLAFHEEMLEYSRTPAPIGSMNDPIGIHQHQRPSTDSLEKWMELGRTPQDRHLAISYLESLGRDVIERLGYSFDDIRRSLDATSDEKHAEHVFPWSIAMRPQRDWTLRERFVADRYFAVRARGTIRGTLSAGKRLAKSMLTEVRRIAAAPALARNTRVR